MGSEPLNVHFLFNIMLFVFHRDVDEEAYVMQKVIKLQELYKKVGII